MNKIIIPVLASVLILGVLGTAEDAFAPKKLFVGNLSWNTEAQSFEATLEMNHGMFKAIQNAGFTLFTQISWSGGGVSFNQEESTSGDRQGDEFGRIKVQFPWDRSLPDGSSFEGFTDVTVNSQILNPAGKPVAVAEPKTFEVEIVPPNTPPTIESVTFKQEGNELFIFPSVGTHFIVLRDFPTECIAKGVVSDTDGDPVTLTYEWLRADGTSIIPEITLPASSPTGSTLPAFPPGVNLFDIISCKVTPFDGIDFGAPASQLACLHSQGLGFGGPCLTPIP